MPEKLLLTYGHDPMCSFCWAFRPVWAKIKAELLAQFPDMKIQYLMGGLAPDSDDPMPEQLKKSLIETWRYIEQNIPGTRFNYDFWHRQQPRRSTYPACRAVVAAKMLDPDIEDSMVHAIQQAYYLNAQNPSNESTLIQCAQLIGLDKEKFRQTFHSPACEKIFTHHRIQSRQLGITAFPSLVLSNGNSRFNIPVDYHTTEHMIHRVREATDYLQNGK